MMLSWSIAAIAGSIYTDVYVFVVLGRNASSSSAGYRGPGVYIQRIKVTWKVFLAIAQGKYEAVIICQVYAYTNYGA